MIKQMENTQNVFVSVSCLLPERKSILNLCVPNNMESKHIKAKWMNESINEMINSTTTLEDLNISLPEICFKQINASKNIEYLYTTIRWSHQFIYRMLHSANREYLLFSSMTMGPVVSVSTADSIIQE